MSTTSGWLVQLIHITVSVQCEIHTQKRTAYTHNVVAVSLVSSCCRQTKSQIQNLSSASIITAS